MAWILSLLICCLISGAIYYHNKYWQKEHALLITHPWTGFARYFLDWFFQYIRTHLHKDWEERPFNRLTRRWIRQSATGQSNYISFGSEQNPNEPGSIIFANSTFPILEEDALTYPGVWIGKDTCENPYLAKSFFNITGMSHGSIGHTAIEALAKGAELAGCWINTGEGHITEWHRFSNNITHQMGTAKYGCGTHDHYLDEDKYRSIMTLPQVVLGEIKIAQGAKPGSGGILPADKVTEEIARIRGIDPWRAAISPNRHREIHDIPSLNQFVRRVRNISKKPTGVKIVVGGDYFLEEYFESLHKNSDCIPDFITVDGTEAGTGAAPESLADYVGLPIAQALLVLVDRLIEYDLKDRIKVVASGKLVMPDRVAWALCMGADFVASGRGHLLALGCIQAMKCASGRCPKGITTTDPQYTVALDPSLKSVRVANYIRKIQHEVEVIAHSCGLKHPGEFNRSHARIVTGFGKSKRLNVEFPYPTSKYTS